MKTTNPLIDYKALRAVSPETARLAVISYLKSNHWNKKKTARIFSINRCVVYDIIKKYKEGDLADRSKAPRKVANKTPNEIEALVIKFKNKTNYGPERLSDYLADYENIKISYGTIRHILARNKDKLIKKQRHKVRRGKREFVDWYNAKAFEIVQIDLKHIRDKKALSKEQMIHLDKFNIPNYQWSALDVNSRFKLIA